MAFGLHEQDGFIDWLRARKAELNWREQRTLVEGVSAVADWVVTHFPPERYSYVGLGRSPAGLIAVLADRRLIALNVPISRPDIVLPGPVTADAVLPAVVRGRPLSEQQRSMLRQHFDEFLRGLPTDRPVLVIDNADTGASVVLAQHYVQDYLGTRADPAPEVHALAISNRASRLVEDDWPQSTPPPDATVLAQRAAWRSRFHRLLLETVGLLSDEQNHVMRRVGTVDAMDGFAEYGSFKLLDATVADFDAIRPRLGASAQEGYQLLRQVMTPKRTGDPQPNPDNYVVDPAPVGSRYVNAPDVTDIEGEFEIGLELPTSVDPKALPYEVRHPLFDVVPETIRSSVGFEIVMKPMTVLPGERDKVDPDSTWAAVEAFVNALTDPSSDGKTLAEVFADLDVYARSTPTPAPV